MKALKFSGDYDIIIERGKSNLYSQLRKMEILRNKEEHINMTQKLPQTWDIMIKSR